MGILDLFTGRTGSLLATGSARKGIASPYSTGDSHVATIAVSDLYPAEVLDKLPMTRGDAIAIPAVSKARNLLVATTMRFPLRVEQMSNGVATDVTKDHAWLHRTNGAVGPAERMAWTIDDLIFEGCSLWFLTRGAASGNDTRRPILDAERVAPESWWIEERRGQLVVVRDDEELAPEQYILINSPFEGLLNIGQRTLRGARSTEDAWVGRAKNPLPLVDIHVTDDTPMDDPELRELVDAWSSARTKPNGAIGATPSNVELNVHGDVKTDFMVESRNAIRTDIGSFLNIRVAMLDGTIGVDSLTYSTKDGERNAFYEFDLPFWTDPIQDRLSLDDVVPRGTRIRFDMYHAFNGPAATGATTED